LPIAPLHPQPTHSFRGAALRAAQFFLNPHEPLLVKSWLEFLRKLLIQQLTGCPLHILSEKSTTMHNQVAQNCRNDSSGFWDQLFFYLDAGAIRLGMVGLGSANLRNDQDTF